MVVDVRAVMRLTRPALTGGRPLYLEEDVKTMLDSQMTVNGAPSITGVQLLLPQSFEYVVVPM